MKKECYLLQPPQIEVYEVKGGTDVILRKNIQEAKKKGEGTEDEYDFYECEETQFRYKGIITEKEIEADTDYWWSVSEGKNIEEPTVIERIEALEGAFMELAEVMING